ncbi:MAG: hypothetical protein H6617_03020 [Bdellovibrionaceae bacterium]|nr:hypothetical protein [Pseudobdellovibrionaceae bacterium]
MDNILNFAHHMRKPYGYLDALLRTRKFYAKEQELKQQAEKLLAVVRSENNQRLSRFAFLRGSATLGNSAGLGY